MELSPLDLGKVILGLMAGLATVIGAYRKIMVGPDLRRMRQLSDLKGSSETLRQLVVCEQINAVFCTRSLSPRIVDACLRHPEPQRALLHASKAVMLVDERDGVLMALGMYDPQKRSGNWMVIVPMTLIILLCGFGAVLLPILTSLNTLPWYAKLAALGATWVMLLPWLVFAVGEIASVLSAREFFDRYKPDVVRAHMQKMSHPNALPALALQGETGASVSSHREGA